MNITVFGLGYVGVVNIACLSKLGHKLYGCDVKSNKADLINSGKSTILEPGIDELLETGHRSGMILGTTEAEVCIQNTDMALICVGTPSDGEGNVNLNYIINTSLDLAKALKDLNRNYTVVYRSTIPPGTIETVVLPEFKKVLGESMNRVNLVFMPEFLREGSAVKDFFHAARIVIGLNEKEQGKKEMESVFNFSKEIPLVFTDYKTAEFVKYVDNAFHATKVAFANEIYSLGAKFGVNIPLANKLFLMDNILNISTRYLKPGTPFGGSCLPKDTRAILNLAQQTNTEVPFFEGLIASNKKHQQRLLKKVQAFGKTKLLLYGLTFKQNTDDIRESPFLVLLRSLVELKLEVKVYDPNLNLSALRIEFPDIAKYVETVESKALDGAELIVMSKNAMEHLLKVTKPEQIILNCFDNEDYSMGKRSVINLIS
jgi:GDP-mannose 6-dehydrogenase